MLAENITYTRRKHYLHPLKMLPTPVENFTYTGRKCYLCRSKMLPTLAKNITNDSARKFAYSR